MYLGSDSGQLQAEGPHRGPMSLLPGEWFRLSDGGEAGAMGKEASVEIGGGSPCRAHAGLSSSLGYPEQRADCHMLSLGDRPVSPGVGWCTVQLQPLLNHPHPS